MAAALPHGRVQASAEPARHPGALRVTGTLTAPAELRPTTANPPHLLLCVQLQPAQGLPYTARVDLGTDVADHMAAEALLPHLRPGAVLSLAGAALELRMDHGHAALRVLEAHSALLLQHAIAQPAPAEPDLFSPGFTPTPATHTAHQPQEA
jgi:hypothetical protein